MACFKNRLQAYKYQALFWLLCLFMVGCSTYETSRDFSSYSSLPVFVQASKGSFNHQAIRQLYQESAQPTPVLEFSGTPLNTFFMAQLHGGTAFVALRNDLVPGHLVPATVDALKMFDVIDVLGAVLMKINLCVLRHQSSDVPLNRMERVMSHPAALSQATDIIGQYHWQTINEPLGTAEAARKLSAHAVDIDRVVVMGSCYLAQLYPNLSVVQENVQDRQENYTLFGQLIVRKRKRPVSENAARKVLNKTIEKARQYVVQ